MSTDELFASLGGSLMKDLWADLQVDNDDGIDFSLEQLEQELARLDDNPQVEAPPLAVSTSLAAFTSPLSAASLVVSHHHDAAAFSQYYTGTTSSTSQDSSSRQNNNNNNQLLQGDAWSKSLEKFTAMSLEKDFLAADTAKKTLKSTSKQAPPPGFLADAQDYNVDEKVVSKSILPPPPGLRSNVPSKPPGMPSPDRPPKINNQKQTTTSDQPILNNKSTAALPEPDDNNEPTTTALPQSPPNRLPITPRNSLALPEEEEEEEQKKISEKQNKAGFMKREGPIVSLSQLPFETKQPKIPILPPPPTPQNSLVLPDVPPTPSNSMSQITEQPVPTPTGTGIDMAKPLLLDNNRPPETTTAMPPTTNNIAPITAVPIAVSSPPQTTWQPPPPPRQPVYCNVHPSAQPIPATVLESSMMKSRDLAYIVHSILKPVLMMGTSPFDYDLIFLRRHYAAIASSSSPSGQKSAVVQQQEMQSRQGKSMEWMKDKHTLGHTTKADVRRPRALLATPTLVKDVEQQQRASLWKARLFIDQGYQACQNLERVWMEAPPGTVPPAVQPHLLKLFKVLGMTVKDGTYQMDHKNSLDDILKMTKGRTFVARLLEKRGLLPPLAIQAMLPRCFENLIPNQDSDDRMFVAMGRIIATLPDMEGSTLIDCLATIEKKEQVTASQYRMECIHALLQRASVLAASGFVPQWAEAEQRFIELLG